MQIVGDAFRQGNVGELTVPLGRVRIQRLGAEVGVHPLAKLAQHGEAALADLRPAVFALEVDRPADGEDAGDVAGRLLLVAADKGVLARPAPTDRQRFHPFLVLGPDVQERGSLWRAEPLVEIAGVDVGADGLQVELELTGHVRAVDDRQDAGFAGAGANLLDRQDHRRAGGDVREEDRAGAVRDAVPERLDDRLATRRRQRDRLVDVAGAGLGAKVIPRHVQRAVLEVGRQDLIARLQRQRAGDHIEAGGGVGDECEVVWIGIEIGADPAAGGVEQRLLPSLYEGHRLPLQLALPRLPDLEHGPRRGAERTVIEKHDAGVEQELLAQRLRAVVDIGGGDGGRGGDHDGPFAAGVGEARRSGSPHDHSGNRLGTRWGGRRTVWMDRIWPGASARRERDHDRAPSTIAGDGFRHRP